MDQKFEQQIKNQTNRKTVKYVDEHLQYQTDQKKSQINRSKVESTDQTSDQPIKIQINRYKAKLTE